ncbi:MAG: hypothetical protein HYR85_21770 [Planctomycetes bacterium]|nr:hypothetical protein [Planctomycetota bacterium]MBI3848028.1 hypothetical protein [Planctomycetota bacterium]
MKPAPVVLAASLLCACGTRTEDRSKPPIVVEAKVDVADARVGDVVKYRIVVDHVPSLSVEFPSITSGVGGFDVVGTSSDHRESGGRVVDERRFDLRTFDLGRHEIPAATIKFGERSTDQTEVAPSLVVEVKSLLPEDANAPVELRDVKAPMSMPPEKPRWALWAGGGVLVLGAALAAWLALRRRAAKPAVAVRAVPALPPHEFALRALQALRARDLPGKGEFDAYTVELTGIVRRYIEARFQVSAPEMTTEEFLNEVGRGRLLDAGPSDLVRDVLRRADLVKFAAYQPTRFEADELLAAAERFVDQTKDLAAAFAAEAAVA